MAADVLSQLQAAPKVELHVHLDGALDTESLFAASRQFRDELPEKRVCPWEDPKTKEHPVVYPQSELGDCRTLEEFKAMVTSKAEVGLYPLLKVFYRYLPVVTGRNELLEEFAFKFCALQAKNNVVYSEVRYSPHEFLPEEHRASPPPGAARAVVESVSRGLRRGEAEFSIVVRQILCLINFSPQWSMDTVETALASRDLGVVGLDIAAGEHHFDIQDLHAAHKAALDRAQEAGMPITVHAGEDGPASAVRKAIDAYHARRIGHGYHILEDEELCARIAREQVHLECCPTSSLLTGAFAGSWADHPIKTFVRSGMSVSLNSDDPMVLDVDMRGEVAMALEKIGLTAEELRACTRSAIDAAFCDEAAKAAVRERVDAFWAGEGPN